MGKFVVIEGLDGSGKSTQIKLLIEYFESKNISYKFLHFPRLDCKFTGEMIARFLRGEYGKANEVNPRLVAYLYAIDRNQSKTDIDSWIKEYDVVLMDRYVYSNIAFQCAKLNKIEEKVELSDWIINLEYNFFAIPVPDISLFLHVPFEFIVKSLTCDRQGDDRHYLNGEIDIHENDLELQRCVFFEYQRLIDSFIDIKSVDCVDNDGNYLPKEAVFHRILELIRQYMVIK